jgi:two-component system chemotaxis response regulator CheB
LAGRDIIVIGASAGGVPALTELLRGLPADLPAALFVVIHTSPTSPGILPQILQRAGKLPAAHAEDGEPIRHGRIYVAPPDRHLLIKHDRVRVVRGPKENGFRPAADPLFRTAARTCGARTVGVVLSGGLDDGTEGLAIIKQYGGTAIVQDPTEATFPSMPASAIANVDVDHVLPVAQMPPLLDGLAREPLPRGARVMPPHNGDEPDVAEVGDASMLAKDLPGPPTGFTCPECGGALWELRNGRLLKFRCHVGHSYTADGLVAEQTRDLESALWTALRALEENAGLRRRMAKRAKGGSYPSIAADYEKQADEAEARAAVIRKVLTADDARRELPRPTPQPPRPNRDAIVSGDRATKRPTGKKRTQPRATGKDNNGAGKRRARRSN